MAPVKAMARVAGKTLLFRGPLLRATTNPHFTKVFANAAIVMAFTAVC